jgi:hypothetical protein
MSPPCGIAIPSRAVIAHAKRSSRCCGGKRGSHRVRGPIRVLSGIVGLPIDNYG